MWMIDRMAFENFKMHTNEKVFEIPGSCVISGRNGSGKTTFLDGYFWVLFDTDAAGKSNPDVQSIGRTESDPSVTISFINEKSEHLYVRKYQVDGRTAKEREAGIVQRKNVNKYEINGIPKTQKDFFGELAYDYGFGFSGRKGFEKEKLLSLIDPDAFTEQKTEKCREVLTGMASEKSNAEIAAELEYNELAGLLEKYRPDEIRSLQKKVIKEKGMRVEVIPEQVKGLERALSEVTTDSGQAQKRKAAAEEEIVKLSAELDNLTVPDTDALKNEINVLRQKRQNRVDEANMEIHRAQADILQKVKEAEFAVSSSEREKEMQKSALATSKRQLETEKKRYDKAIQKWKALKEKKFDESAAVCPTCGQKLPEKQLSAAVKKFADEVAESKQAVKTDGEEADREVKRLIKEVSKAEKELEKTDEKLSKQKSALRDLRKQEKEVSKKHVEPDMSDIDKEVAELNARIAGTNKILAQRKIINQQISAQRQVIDAAIQSIVEANNNARIAEQIEELNAEKKEAQRQREAAEKLIHELSMLETKKNELLSQAVNEHFSLVTFKLFEQQKNGEYKSVCIPMIEGKTLGASANTGLEIRAKLDIIAGLQKFYGVSYPVILDNAAELDSESRSKINMPCQMIYLVVTDDELKITGG